MKISRSNFIRVTVIAAVVGAVHFSPTSLQATEELLKKNADFEEWNEQTLLPKNWGDNTTFPAKIKIVADKNEAHEGEACVSVENTASKDGAISYNTLLPVLPEGKYHAKIWARGAGKITFQFYQSSAEGFITPKANAYSKFLELSDKWTEYSFDYVPRPEDEVVKVQFAIHTKGQVYLDDASVTEVESVK